MKKGKESSSPDAIFNLYGGKMYNCQENADYKCLYEDSIWEYFNRFVKIGSRDDEFLYINHHNALDVELKVDDSSCKIAGHTNHSIDLDCSYGKPRDISDISFTFAFGGNEVKCHEGVSDDNLEQCAFSDGLIQTNQSIRLETGSKPNEIDIRYLNDQYPIQIQLNEDARWFERGKAEDNGNDRYYLNIDFMYC
ncbi:MAG: hypothetical protein HRK26_04360 [Rickettsiaceae bacterium H1]|nr:hypothetical protein [Rickettsiaceae bacterium H1]